MPLLSTALRKNIGYRLKTAAFPVWSALLIVAGFLVSDTVEHHRLFSFIFLYDSHYQDLVEELYEFPLIIGLFIIALQFMRQDKDCMKSGSVT